MDALGTREGSETHSDLNTNAASVGVIGRIPVRNIWLLMLYASDLYRELPFEKSVDVEYNPDKLPDLVAELLTGAVVRRMRRNLSLGYRFRKANLDRVRGRIDLLRTERRQLLQRGRVACSFEELTVNTPRNQFVKAALNRLRRVVKDKDLAQRCRSVEANMERAGVTGNPASKTRNRLRTPLSRIGRLGAEDRQMVAAARLAFDLALPTEDAGSSHLATPDRDEVWARRLFERAVAGFYDVALSPQGWRVSHGNWIHWDVSAKSSGIDDFLPSMQTDIALEHTAADGHRVGPKRIVIDTKFTSMLVGGRFGKLRLDSSYIYQIYAYLMSQECEADQSTLDSAGILLHPSLGCGFDEFAVVQGHKIRFATVDLSADSSRIRCQLLKIVEST